ncbi:uncharacterized protein LOC141644055 [Silene latifolia]|uniref:uncharacterized protein LOC141644055 n=1 Tax=Silene latifolia TaxID=37657 RepID=UPI003D77346A
MENITEKASQELDEIKIDTDEIKVDAEMGVAATEPDILVISGPHIVVIGNFDDGDLRSRVGRAVELSGLSISGGSYTWRSITPKTEEVFADEDYINMESGGMLSSQIDEGVGTCWWKNKFVECVGYANNYMEKLVKPNMGLLFSAATMQNIYQLITSGVMTTSRGKTLMRMNQAAFLLLLYGLVMPKRAGKHVALTSGVALASAAYLVNMSFAF